MTSNRSNIVWTQNIESGFQKCQSKNPSIFGITFCHRFGTSLGEWLPLPCPKNSKSTWKADRSTRSFTNPADQGCLFPKIPNYSDRFGARMTIKSIWIFFHIESLQQIGIGSPLVFGISKIEWLSFEKKNAQICNRIGKYSSLLQSIWGSYDHQIDLDLFPHRIVAANRYRKPSGFWN